MFFGICVKMEEIQLALTNPNELTLDHKSNGEQADEMHDQYLNRLEASFITQLHQSTGWLARWPNRSVNRGKSAKKKGFRSVFRDGCWEMINFRRATTTDSRDVFKSPWVKRIKHGDKSCSSCLADVSDCSKTIMRRIKEHLRTESKDIQQICLLTRHASLIPLAVYLVSLND